MAFQMNCPNCMKRLNVTEKAFGKTVPCPGCNQPLSIPQQPEMPAPQQTVRVQAALHPSRPATKPVPLPPAVSRPVQKTRQLPNVSLGSIGARPRLSNGTDAEIVRFRCPRCSRVLQTRRQPAGTAMACSCGCNVQIPSLPSQAPPLDGQASVVAPPAILGLLSLFGIAAVVALLSSFLGTLLLGRG
jgi:hypothetical protein